MRYMIIWKRNIPNLCDGLKKFVEQMQTNFVSSLKGKVPAQEILHISLINFTWLASRFYLYTSPKEVQEDLLQKCWIFHRVNLWFIETSRREDWITRKIHIKISTANNILSNFFNCQSYKKTRYAKTHSYLMKKGW